MIIGFREVLNASLRGFILDCRGALVGRIKIPLISDLILALGKNILVHLSSDPKGRAEI